MTDLRWAWRNLRSRGWRPALAIGLLAVALAANTLMFAVADSLVFHRAAYGEPDRLVEFQDRDARTGRPGGSPSLTPALFDEWRNQRDLFEGVEGHLNKVIFLSGTAEPELVQAADVTLGLTNLLGVRPRWGRPFAAGDERPTDTQAVLISESLARQRFGDPSRAVGQRLETTAGPLTVVGVMPAQFRYPDSSQRIWRALDPRGPLAFGYAGVTAIARLAPGLSFESATSIAEKRSADIGRAAGARAGYTVGLFHWKCSKRRPSGARSCSFSLERPFVCCSSHARMPRLSSWQAH